MPAAHISAFCSASPCRGPHARRVVCYTERPVRGRVFSVRRGAVAYTAIAYLYMQAEFPPTKQIFVQAGLLILRDLFLKVLRRSQNLRAFHLKGQEVFAPAYYSINVS